MIGDEEYSMDENGKRWGNMREVEKALRGTRRRKRNPLQRAKRWGQTGLNTENERN